MIKDVDAMVENSIYQPNNLRIKEVFEKMNSLLNFAPFHLIAKLLVIISVIETDASKIIEGIVADRTAAMRIIIYQTKARNSGLIAYELGETYVFRNLKLKLQNKSIHLLSDKLTLAFLSKEKIVDEGLEDLSKISISLINTLN